MFADYIVPPEEFVVKLDSVPYNKLIVLYLKANEFKDESGILFNQLNCTFPYFVINTNDKTIKMMRDYPHHDLRVRCTSRDFQELKLIITTPNPKDYVMGTPMTC